MNNRKVMERLRRMAREQEAVSERRRAYYRLIRTAGAVDAPDADYAPAEPQPPELGLSTGNQQSGNGV